MSIWKNILSVLAAFFGVQSSKNHIRDFEQGNPIIFFVLGLILTCVFLLSVLGIVNYVVSLR